MPAQAKAPEVPRRRRGRDGHVAVATSKGEDGRAWHITHLIGLQEEPLHACRVAGRHEGQKEVERLSRHDPVFCTLWPKPRHNGLQQRRTLRRRSEGLSESHALG